MSTPKSLPLKREEVMHLVQLVEANPIIFSRATNASNNQLKDAAWKKVTKSFNAVVASTPRRVAQLRLKWENLKKAARKRSTMIKEGCRKPEYLPRNEALDQVAAIIGSTCDGSSVPVGGDTEKQIDEVFVLEKLVPEPTLNGPFGDSDNIPTKTPALSPHTPQPKKFFSSSVNSEGKFKHQATADEVKASIVRKNRAVAEYYDAKRKNEETKLALEKRKMEIEILLMEQKMCRTNSKIGDDDF